MSHGRVSRLAVCFTFRSATIRLANHIGIGGDHMSGSRLISWCIFGCLIAALSLSGPAIAACITQTLGHMTYHYCDGKVVWSQTVGGITVHSGPLFSDR